MQFAVLDSIHYSPVHFYCPRFDFIDYTAHFLTLDCLAQSTTLAGPALQARSALSDQSGLFYHFNPPITADRAGPD